MCSASTSPRISSIGTCMTYACIESTEALAEIGSRAAFRSRWALALGQARNGVAIVNVGMEALSATFLRGGIVSVVVAALRKACGSRCLRRRPEQWS